MELDKGPDEVAILAPPTDFVEVWNDEKAGSKYGECSIWEAIAPNGYGHQAG